MNLVICAFVSLMIAADAETTTPSPPVRVKVPDTRLNTAIAGDYRADKQSVVRILPLGDGPYYSIHSERWDGVGLLEGSKYIGVFRSLPGQSDPSLPKTGRQVIDFADPGHPRVLMSPDGSDRSTSTETWSRVAAGDCSECIPEDSLTVATDPDHPKLGEYVVIEELPGVSPILGPAVMTGSPA
jgi:hypothetical protein